MAVSRPSPRFAHKVKADSLVILCLLFIVALNSKGDTAAGTAAPPLALQAATSTPSPTPSPNPRSSVPSNPPTSNGRVPRLHHRNADLYSVLSDGSFATSQIIHSLPWGCGIRRCR